MRLLYWLKSKLYPDWLGRSILTVAVLPIIVTAMFFSTSVGAFVASGAVYLGMVGLARWLKLSKRRGKIIS
jgi:hypothetical protein